MALPWTQHYRRRVPVPGQVDDGLQADGTLAFRRLLGNKHRRRVGDVLLLAEERDRRQRSTGVICSALRELPNRRDHRSANRRDQGRSGVSLRVFIEWEGEGS